MYILYIITAAALLISLVFSRKKTVKALKVAFNRFARIILPFLFMLALVSIVLFFFSEKFIAELLENGSLFYGTGVAALVGSIALMPGFIAFPLCGILLSKGVPYMIIAGFSTTLMMVGVVTFPLEKEYLGIKVALIRNGISVGISILVAIAIGVFFGEIL